MTDPWEKHGGPAFPTDDGDRLHYRGMTLRDYFAAHAPEPSKEWHGGERKKCDIVEWRYAYADAMLAEREKP